MTLTKFRNTVEWALMVAFVFGAGAIAQAQNEDATAQGRIVQISPSTDDTTIDVEQGAVDATPVEQPKHWIGLLGGPVTPELRAQIDLPEDQGLLVRQVVPDSPAAKAGLENFDILLRANDTDLHEMGDLVELVRTAGDQNTPITLDVLRRGQHVTVQVTPESRPERIANQQLPGEAQGQPFGDGFRGVPDDVLKFFEQRSGVDGGPFAFRMFGPGTVLQHRGAGLGSMPNGISVSIQKQNDEPAHITVQRGNDTWTITGDDPGSLEQLPADLRPFVENLLHGTGGMQMPMPEFRQFNMPAPGLGMEGMFDQGEVMERLQAMEQHLRQLEERLENRALAPADIGSPDAEQQSDLK